MSATWLSAWPKGRYQAKVSDHDYHQDIVIIIPTVPPQSPSLPPGFPFVQAFPICHPSIRLTCCKTMGIYWPLWAHAAVSRASPVLLTLNLPVSWSLHPAFDSVCVPKRRGLHKWFKLSPGLGAGWVLLSRNMAFSLRPLSAN